MLEPVEDTAQAPALEVYVLVTPDGVSPFEQWFRKLRDRMARVRIDSRIDRIQRTGNFGDVKPVGEGVSEIRIDYGPGYRLYFGQIGNAVVLLLVGGDKRTQTTDIIEAKKLWTTWKDTKGNSDDPEALGRRYTQ